MLLIYLILFTKVLADSDEDNYVDLLPDDEKQQFIDNVARRILKDVDSQENGDVQSGEMTDERLEEQTEYVKAILKEEEENIKRSKGKTGKDKEEKSASEEKKTLGVKPLKNEKNSSHKDPDKRIDLTISNEKKESAVSNESSTNNIKVEIVTNDVPIIKRSVQDDNANKNFDSEETTSETLDKVLKTNKTFEESNEVEFSTEKSGNTTPQELMSVASELFGSKNDNLFKIESMAETKLADNESNNSKEENKEKYLKVTESNYNSSGEINLSVKGIKESGSRKSNNENSKSAENTTESDDITSAVEYFGVKSIEHQSDKYSNISNTSEETRTLVYPFERVSTKGTTSESTITDIQISGSTKTTNTDEDTDPPIESKNDTDYELDAKTKSTLTRTITDEVATEFVPEIVTITEIPETTEAETESTTLSDTTENTTENILVSTTKEKNIVIENFMSALTATSVKSPVKKKMLKNKRLDNIKNIKERALESSKATINTLDSDEESIEATTNKIKHEVIVHKYEKLIVGPRAKKITAGEEVGTHDKNFIDLEKVYYDNNNYKVKVGKEYHVFEIPADKTPFIEDPTIDQPYYVPTYNYSPNNAYFNPQNRLGPNPEDSNANAFFANNDDIVDNKQTNNADMKYSDAAFDNKELETNDEVNPEGYLDSNHYFGSVKEDLERRVNEKDFHSFLNSNENDHPALNIKEVNLKDHVREVRNKLSILLEKDKYGEQNNELKTKMRTDNKIRISEAKFEHILSTTPRVESKTKKNNKDDNKIAMDYYFLREEPAVMMDIKYNEKSNGKTNELYVMDKFFKKNVEYIQDSDLKSVLPHPNKATQISMNIEKEIAFQEQNQKLVMEFMKINNAIRKDRANFENTYVTSEIQRENVPVNPNENNNLELPVNEAFNKLNLRRGDVVKVGVFLQVLEDMINLGNKALIQYDWLGTTVDIQSALQKLFELTDQVANKENLHPADKEILKYLLFLHKLASEIIEAKDIEAQLKKNLLLPRKQKRKPNPRILEQKGLINKIWLYLRKEIPEVNEYKALNFFNNFLIDVEDGLHDLHDAIKSIAKITKYKNQDWYQNLKDLYINTDEKHLLELLLHMAALRLFGLIEESAKNGMEDDYIQYMKQNRRHVKRTLKEMKFVMEILEDYSKFVS